MTLEERIYKLEVQMENLRNSYLQSQKNQVSITNRTDMAYNKVEAVTPYTETKGGYYGEKEKTFYDAPMGNVSVFFDNYNGNYAISRVDNRLIVSFDELKAETNITISIQ